jgi:hypothetical protein
MIDAIDWEWLRFWGATALFNPVFLAFLLAVYFMGKFIGRLASRPNVWKLLLLCYLGVFLFEPLRNAGWILGSIFLIGFFSGTIRNLPGILTWAESFGDIYFALRYRRAYEQLKAQEQAFEEELRRTREGAARTNTGQSRTQQNWKAEAEEARGKAKASSNGDKGQDGGRQSQSSGQSSSYDRLSGAQQKPQNDDIRRKHLKTLGLNPSESHSLHDIKRAYRKRVKECHPDVGGDSNELRQVVNAWEWLRKVKN